MRYAVAPDGALTDGRVFFDVRADGLAVDRDGNLYVAGPRAAMVISASGRHLGTLRLPEQPTNFAWGDADRRTLYITAATAVYRIRLEIPGAGRALRP